MTRTGFPYRRSGGSPTRPWDRSAHAHETGGRRMRWEGGRARRAAYQRPFCGVSEPGRRSLRKVGFTGGEEGDPGLPGRFHCRKRRFPRGIAADDAGSAPTWARQATSPRGSRRSRAPDPFPGGDVAIPCWKRPCDRGQRRDPLGNITYVDGSRGSRLSREINPSAAALVRSRRASGGRCGRGLRGRSLFLPGAELRSGIIV